MQKHAYLILVQNQPELLKYQLALLDHERCDLYIHIDKRVKIRNLQSLLSSVKRAGISVAEPMTVTYGAYSQIQRLLKLLRMATKQKYQYYHLFSDYDLPLRNQAHILNFFDQHQGKEFIYFYGKNFADGMKNRFQFLPQKYDAGFRLFGKKRVKLRFPWDLSTQLNPEATAPQGGGFDLQNGLGFGSITHDLASLLVLKEAWCEQYLSSMEGACEVFLQTILWNSQMRGKQFYRREDSPQTALMRNFRYTQGCIVPWKRNELNTLIQSPFLFACGVQTQDDLAAEIQHHIEKK